MKGGGGATEGSHSVWSRLVKIELATLVVCMFLLLRSASMTQSTVNSY